MTSQMKAKLDRVVCDDSQTEINILQFQISKRLVCSGLVMAETCLFIQLDDCTDTEQPHLDFPELAAISRACFDQKPDTENHFGLEIEPDRSLPIFCLCTRAPRSTERITQKRQHHGWRRTL